MSKQEKAALPDPFKPCECGGQCGRVHASGKCVKPAQKDQWGVRRKIGDAYMTFCRHCADDFDSRARELTGVVYNPTKIEDDKDQVVMFKEPPDERLAASRS